MGKRRAAEVLLDRAVPSINAMFWKKPPGSLRKVTQPETPQARSAPRMQVAVDDAALDTVAGLLKSFGEHAFDTESVTAADTRSECDGWAQRITVGEGKKGEDELSFKRDWSGVRRYFTAQRAHEREYVGRSLGNLREAVHAFARCLTSTVSEDRAADERVGAQLGRLVGAFQSNDSEAIRQEAEGIVSVVREVLDERTASQQQVLSELKDTISKLNVELHDVREKAALDPLTQLYNRASLDAHLDRLADLSFLLSSSPCILMLDIDNFKAINDKHGHATGDKVLRGVADILVRIFLRREDFVARYGGEEFVVVIPDSSLHNAEVRAERVRQAISELEVVSGTARLSVTASIGIAALSAGDAGASWLARADAALYEAKGAGRDCVRLAREALPVLVLGTPSLTPLSARTSTRPSRRTSQ